MNVHTCMALGRGIKQTIVELCGVLSLFLAARPIEWGNRNPGVGWPFVHRSAHAHAYTIRLSSWMAHEGVVLLFRPEDSGVFVFVGVMRWKHE